MNLFLSTIFQKSFLPLLMIDSFRNDENFIVTLLLMGAIFAFFAIIIGIAIVIIISAIVFFLISAGLISASVLVGFQNKSASSGFKTFFILVSILGSSIVSVVFFLFMNSVKDWWPTETTIFAGIIFGGVVGWLLGLLMFLAFKNIAVFLKTKVEKRFLEK